MNSLHAPARIENSSSRENSPSVNFPGAATLAALHERLGSAELRRRFWHMTPGLFPFILLAIPHPDPMSIRGRVEMAIIALVIGIAIVRKYSLIRRAGEAATDRLQAVIGYAGAVLATLLLFPAQMELGMALLGILAFGDGSATLAGLTFGGARCPWNRSKSWIGCAAFVLVGGTAASLFYWMEARPGVPIGTALACGMVAATLAALAESLPSRINDNIRVGAIAALSLIAMHGWLVGW